MQKIVQIVFISAAVFIASCETKKESSAALQEKKAELEALKKQQTEIGDKISKLEVAIAKLDTSAAKQEKAKLVSVKSLTADTFIHYIDLQGKIEAVNISYVTPRNGGGQVKALFVKKGDYVNKGQLLLKLDDAIIKQSLIAGEQNINTLKTQLAFAKNLYQKQKNLWDQNIGTEVQLITAKNNVDNLSNQLKATEEQVKITKEQVNFTNIYADVSGVLEEVNVRVGELFTGLAGLTPQIKIVNTSDLKVTVQVPENYLGSVHVGTPVKLTFPDINKDIMAKVSVAGKLIDPNSRSFFAEVKIPSDKAFHPNQIAFVKIQDYTNKETIIVPVNTLQTDEKGKFVMVAATENGKTIARKKQIIIGTIYGDDVEVKSGLQKGDVLITDGYQSLYDGQLITTSVK